MNINIFLSIVLVGLSMIYFFFKPMNLKQTEDKEIPQFSLEEFILYEFDQNGLMTKMKGEKGISYSDRYVVENIDYTDNSEDFLTNMKAKHGLYKRDVVYLKGDVKLNRDDGLRFFSQKVKYDKNKEIASTDVEYVSYMGENYIKGKNAVLDNQNKTIISKTIYAVYNLEEKKKQ